MFVSASDRGLSVVVAVQRRAKGALQWKNHVFFFFLFVFRLGIDVYFYLVLCPIYLLFFCRLSGS